MLGGEQHAIVDCKIVKAKPHTRKLVFAFGKYFLKLCKQIRIKLTQQTSFCRSQAGSDVCCLPVDLLDAWFAATFLTAKII